MQTLTQVEELMAANRPTAMAFEVLSQNNMKALGDAFYEMASASVPRGERSDEERSAVKIRLMAGRLARAIGAMEARSEWPGHLSTDTQFHKIDLHAICAHYLFLVDKASILYTEADWPFLDEKWLDAAILAKSDAKLI